MRVSTRLSSTVNAKGWTLLPLARGRLRSLRGSTSVSQGGPGTPGCFSGDFPSCPHVLRLGLPTERSQPLECFQRELNRRVCSSSSVALLQPPPSPGYRQGVSPLHQPFLLEICSYCTVPPANVVTAQMRHRWVREPCGGGKPFRPHPALRVTPLKPAIPDSVEQMWIRNGSSPFLCWNTAILPV